LSENIKDGEDYPGIKMLRQMVGKGPKELNNIDHPNVIKKIWEEIKKSPGIKNSGLTMETFFGLDKHPIYPNEEYPIYSKVNTLYLKLNQIGYHPDQDIEKPNKFSGSMIDSSHVGNAMFCKFFATSDGKLAKKCSAIYEYLGISTRVIHFKKGQ